LNEVFEKLNDGRAPNTQWEPDARVLSVTAALAVVAVTVDLRVTLISMCCRQIAKSIKQARDRHLP